MPDHADTLVSLYREAADDLSGWLTRGTDFQRVRAETLINQIEDIGDRLNKRVVSEVGRAVIDDYRKGAGRTDRTLLKIGLPADELAPSGQFDRINERSVEILARDISHDLLNGGTQLVENSKRLIRRTQALALSNPDVSRVIAKGLIAGGSVRRVAKDLQSQLAEGEARRLLAEGRIPIDFAEEAARAADGVIEVGRRNMRIKDYADIVARTRLAEAVTIATEDRCVQNGVTLVMITGPRTDDFCDYFVGRVFSITGDSDEYPALEDIAGEGAPFHPRCTHAEAPFVPKFASDDELKRARNTDERLLGASAREAQAIFKQDKADGEEPRPREVHGMRAAA